MAIALLLGGAGRRLVKRCTIIVGRRLVLEICRAC